MAKTRQRSIRMDDESFEAVQSLKKRLNRRSIGFVMSELAKSAARFVDSRPSQEEVEQALRSLGLLG